MSGGLTISRHAIDPVANQERLKELAPLNLDEEDFDINKNNSVRCAANL